MTSRNLDRLLIHPYEKKGASRHVEQTVQSVLDKQDVASQTLKNSNAWLDSHFPDTISGRYRKATRKVQIALGTMGHLAAQNAMPKLIKKYESSGSLSATDEIPTDRFNTFNDFSQLPPSVQEAYHTSYWLIEACNEMQTFLEATNHPLLDYYDTNNTHRHHTWQQWREGPGHNRWPTHRNMESLVDTFTDSILKNTQLCVSLMSSKAIHCMLTTNRLDISSDELGIVAGESIDKMHRHSSPERHLSWEPDWKKRHKDMGYNKKNTPFDGAEALLQCPVSNVIKPNRYAASAEGSLMMQDSDFVQHELLRHNPVAASGACSGNVFYRPSGTHREAARHFFEITGFHPDNGDCFSVAGLALVMSHVALRTILLPAFDINRQKEGIFIADQ